MSEGTVGSTAAERTRENFLFDDLLPEYDPLIQTLIEREEARQVEKLQMIASESLCPRPVIAALASVFSNKYAEGYPSTRMSRRENAELEDIERHLAFYRRYGDRRYYKGTEFCNFVESLAQRRCAELFANENAPLHRIHVNVQPLSGAMANNAAYDAFLQPGDRIMGMHLSHGGHLTHGSPVNRSGKYYRVTAYMLNEEGRIDYDSIDRQARRSRPKMIIAGASAYPWAIDWLRLRRICDAVGAALLADISHVAGLVVARKFPNPVGLADVTMFTTHKTMCGPRGAVLITTDRDIAKRIDLAVFPGEQGGPHMNMIAAKAVAFRIARSEAFRRLQERIIENAIALARAFERCGLPLAYGGTSTHMVLLDLRKLDLPGRGPLTADVASNILDLCGITCNKNTLAGDTNAARPSGLRFGTVVLTQRGMGPQEMERIADLVHGVLSAIEPFGVRGNLGTLTRGRIDYARIRETRRAVEKLTRAFPPFRERTGLERTGPVIRAAGAGPDEVRRAAEEGAVLFDLSEEPLLEICGERAPSFLEQAATGTILGRKGLQRTLFLDAQGEKISGAWILRAGPDPKGRPRFLLLGADPDLHGWLCALSDGYVRIDLDDVHSKVDGPVRIRDLSKVPDPEEQLVHLVLLGPRRKALEPSEVETACDEGEWTHWIVRRLRLPSVIRRLEVEGVVIGRPEQLAELRRTDRTGDPEVDMGKPFFVGRSGMKSRVPAGADGRKEFVFEPPKLKHERRTPLYDRHVQLGARMLSFGTYRMPGWYGRVADEHRAVREAAGLFDVGHMGVFDFTGEAAASFLDTVTTNFVQRLEPGQSQYSYVLDIEGRVMDDIIVYRMSPDRFITVVNAANQDKLWAWFTAVNAGAVRIDREDPLRRAPGPVRIRNLKHVSSGEDARMNLAFQGRASRTVLERLIRDPRQTEKLRSLQRFNHFEAEIEGMSVIVSRTGYTGETVGYELLVHPREAGKLWDLLLETGKDLGVKPAGLGARDSTRTEAGFPLYGHELAGEFDVIPAEAGYQNFVKRHKPFFVGKREIMRKEDATQSTIVRFRMKETGIRAVRAGDLVISPKGRVCGYVTSAVMVEGVQIGLAYCLRAYRKPGRIVGIHRLRRKGKVGRPPLREKFDGPTDEAEVLPRFGTF